MVTAHIQIVALKQQISTQKTREQAAKEINMYKPISISAIALCICTLSGCSEAKCWSKLAPAERTCDYYSGAMLSRCHSDSTRYPYLPNCDLVEYCTDYSTIETESSNNTDSADDSEAISDGDSLVDTNSDTATDSDSDSDSETTIPAGIVCEYVCEGKLVPCDSFSSESQCTRAHHCEWYDNSVD